MFRAVFVAVSCLLLVVYAEEQCKGKSLGSLSDLKSAGIAGKVHVLNETCFELCKFNYDYPAPDMYFWCDKTDKLTSDGTKIPSVETKLKPLGKYKDAHAIACLADGGKVADCKSFGLYCKDFGVLRLDQQVKP